MGSTSLKAQSRDHSLGSRRSKEGCHSIVPLHDGCKSSEAVLFPCTEKKLHNSSLRGSTGQKLVPCFIKKAVKLWFVPHLLLPEWFREGVVQLWQVCCSLPTPIKYYQIYFLGLHLMQRYLVQKKWESAEGQGHSGAGNAHVYVPGFQETAQNFVKIVEEPQRVKLLGPCVMKWSRKSLKA